MSQRKRFDRQSVDPEVISKIMDDVIKKMAPRTPFEVQLAEIDRAARVERQRLNLFQDKSAGKEESVTPSITHTRKSPTR